MALFGVHLVLTMVMASVLAKIMPHYSLAKFLLCKTGLYYFLHPTNEEIKASAGLAPKTRGQKAKNAKKVPEENEEFTFARSTDIELKTAPVTPRDVMGLRFYSEYYWLTDFAVCTLLVYILSEIYTGLFASKSEVNLSMLWCMLVIGFSLKIMFSLTKLYFQGDDSGGEKAMVVLSFFVYLLIALGMLIVSENVLDLGLDQAYMSFNMSANVFLEAQGLNSVGPTSKVTFKIILAFFCAFIGAFFTFPGLRIGKMHFDALKSAGEKSKMKTLLHVSFIAPLFLVALWIRPLSRKYFTETVFHGYSKPIMSPGMFEIIRLTLVLVVALLRLALMPKYLQSYLHMAQEKVDEQKKLAGKISNFEYQRKIAMVFYYLCVVTLQYIAPIIICFFLALMCKTMGGMEWCAIYRPGVSLEDAMTSVDPDMPSTMPFSSIESMSDASQMIAFGLEGLKKVFNSEFFKGVLGFSTWWCVFSWFLSGTFGVLYQTYFTGQ